MKVRCGSCRTQFEVPGAGRYACPVCGSVNAVRGANGAPAEAGPSVGWLSSRARCGTRWWRAASASASASASAASSAAAGRTHAEDRMP